MRKPILSVTVTTLIFLLFTPLTHSDTITLKTGKTPEGLIIQEDADEVVVRISIGTTTLKKD